MAQANSNTLSMQSPERVAETYGGNKQKIAQAVQMGVIDPTTGLMAGMFIDRMRSAQAQEQAPNQTVAQRVLGPQVPPAPPAGLGATPQGMQMAGGPSPQMAAPPQMIPPAPQGPVRMAEGGLTTLPIPDDMYDEQSFSGGGIVAFAPGGSIDDRVAALQKKAAMARTMAARQQYFQAANTLIAEQGIRDVVGGLGSAIAAPFKSIMDYYTAELPTEPENPTTPPGYQSNLSKIDLAPLPSPGFMASAQQPTAAPAAVIPPPPAPVRTPAPPPSGSRTAPPPPTRKSDTPFIDTALRTPRTPPGVKDNPDQTDAEYRAMVDKNFLEANKLPEYKGTSAEDKAARKSEDLYSLLAQIGFGMAAGESPNALTNVGKATAAAMPAMQAAAKERRADDKEDLKQQYAYQLAQAGVKGKAYEFSMNQFDKLKDNRFREETLAETIRHNQELEKLQGRQVVLSGSTGTERLVQLMAAGMPGGATPKNVAKAAEVAIGRYSGAGTGAEIYNKAGDNVDAAISKNPILSQRLRILARLDKENARAGKPSNLYDNEYEKLKKVEYNRLISASLSSLGGPPPVDPLNLF